MSENDKPSTQPPVEEEKPQRAPEKYVGDNVRASWNISLDALRKNIGHCSPEGKEAVIGAFRWCIDARHPMDRYEFCRRINVAENTWYKIMTGKYRHPQTGRQLDIKPQLIKAIRDFLNVEQERYLGGKNDFVLTPTAKQIWTACELARESQTPVFIIGPSHIGKTWALQYYAHNNNHGRTVYCRVKAASGLGGLVRRIADSCGVSDASNTANLIDRIKNALSPNMLVLMDEVHQLSHTYRKNSFFACLEVIREIYDEVGCGFILCGTRLLMDKVDEAKHSELEQLLKRGVHRLVLGNMPKQEDITLILNAWSLPMPSKRDTVVVSNGSSEYQERPREVLRQLARNAGLKSITERLRYGQKLATNRGEKLEWNHVCEAHLIMQNMSTPPTDWE